ncbi:MAG: LacI family DNA-binding transcriptional regulator [Puniceicoccales bacterium]
MASDFTGKPPSLKSVAAAAGVSAMTASRAFKEGTPVRPEVRARVLREAERLGYRPDRMVSSLMSSLAARKGAQFRETIGAIWWSAVWKELPGNGFFGDVCRGFETAAGLHGCKIEHFCYGGENTAAVLERMLVSRGIESVLVTSPPEASEPAPALDWSRFSVVAVGATLRSPQFHRVMPGHFHAVGMVLSRLASLGISRPCLLVGEDLDYRTHHGYSGAFLASTPDAPQRLWKVADPEQSGLHEWLQRVKPEAVIADNDSWLRRLPDFWAHGRFLSLDANRSTLNCSGIRQQGSYIGECAVDLVMRSRLRNETGIPSRPLTLFCDGEWNEGETFCPERIVEKGRSDRRDPS